MTLSRPHEAPPRRETLITEGVQVRGKLMGGPEDTIRISGRLQGEVETEGCVVISREGRAIADIRAREVVVTGVLQGNILSAERVTLEKTAEVYGNVHAVSARVEDGALIAGRIDVQPETMASEGLAIRTQGAI